MRLSITEDSLKLQPSNQSHLPHHYCHLDTLSLPFVFHSLYLSRSFSLSPILTLFSLYQYGADLQCLISHSSSKQHADPLAGLCWGLPTVPEEPPSTMTKYPSLLPSASKLLKRPEHLTGDQFWLECLTRVKIPLISPHNGGLRLITFSLFDGEAVWMLEVTLKQSLWFHWAKSPGLVLDKSSDVCWLLLGNQ